MPDSKGKKQDKPKAKKVEVQKTTKPKTKKVWFRRWWGVILAIIFFFPFGLYYIWHLWRNKDWTKKKKAGITTAVLMPYLLLIFVIIINWGTPYMSDYATLTNKPQFKVVGRTEWSDAKVEIDLNNVKVQESETNGGNFEKEVTLKEGNNEIILKATNDKGKTKSSTYLITLDTVAPKLEVEKINPENDKGQIEVKGKTESGATVKFLKDNKELLSRKQKNEDFSFVNISLSDGENKFMVISTDKAGNEQKKEFSAYKKILTNKPEYKMAGRTTWEKAKIEIDLNDTKVKEMDTVDSAFENVVTLKEGMNRIEVRLTSDKGEVRFSTYFITLDTVAPKLEVENIGAETDKNKLDIKGKTENSATVKLIKDSKELSKTEQTKDSFSFTNVSLSEGENKFTVVATDKAGNEQKKELTVKYTPKKVEEQKQQTPTTKQEAPKQDDSKELDAEVRFSDTAFQIKNKETQNWVNCKFYVNGIKLFGGDYSYESKSGINANDSVIIPFDEFTKGDGTRFNPYSMKVKNLFMTCDVSGVHRTGYYAISN